MNTMLIGTGLFMLIPMALFATRMYRNRAKEKAAVAALQEAEYVNILCDQGIIILERVPIVIPERWFSLTFSDTPCHVLTSSSQDLPVFMRLRSKLRSERVAFKFLVPKSAWYSKLLRYIRT